MAGAAGSVKENKLLSYSLTLLSDAFSTCNKLRLTGNNPCGASLKFALSRRQPRKGTESSKL